MRWRVALTTQTEIQAEAQAEAITSRDVAKGAGTTLLARLGGVIEVIAQPLYVWLFGLAGYGLYSALWAAVNLVENIADLGMTSALQRTVPQAHSEQEAVSSLRAALVLGVGPCLLIAIIAALAAPSLTHFFNASTQDEGQLAFIIATFVWTLPLWAFVEVATSALRARRVFGAEIRLRLFWEQVVRLIMSVGLWLAQFGTLAIFLAHVASLIAISLLCVRLLARHYDLRLLFKGKLFDAAWHDTLKSGLSILPANIVARLFSDAPTLGLNALLPGAQGAIAGGLFAIARKISSIIQLVRIAFAYVLAPLASAQSKIDRKGVSGIYAFATRVSTAVALPTGIVLAASGSALLALFGKDAAIALPAVAIMVAARVAEAISGAAVPIQQVISGYRSQLLGSFAGIAISLLAVWWTMPHAGLTGMSAAVGLGIVAAAAIPMWQLHRDDDVHPFAPPFGRVIWRSALVASGGLGLTLAAQLLPAPAQLPLIPALLLGSLWCGCRYALPREDREALGKTGRALRLI